MKTVKNDAKKADRYGKRPARPQSAAQGKKQGRPVSGKKPGEQASYTRPANGLQIEGRNAVLEALRSGAAITALYLQEGLTGADLEEIAELARSAGVTPQTVKGERLKTLAESKNPQGVVAKFKEYRFSDISDMLEDAHSKGEDPFIIVLSGIEDPHNFGAIVRSASLLGAHGVVIRRDRATGITPAAAKSSAGALFRTKIAEVTNIAVTLESLKKEGLWIACADMDGQSPDKCDLRGPIALVIGAEGEGVPRLVREKSDFIISIPMARVGTVDSLNASVAAGILMYAVMCRRNA